MKAASLCLPVNLPEPAKGLSPQAKPGESCLIGWLSIPLGFNLGYELPAFQAVFEDRTSKPRSPWYGVLQRMTIS